MQEKNETEIEKKIEIKNFWEIVIKKKKKNCNEDRKQYLK